jgi:hypothetical protein
MAAPQAPFGLCLKCEDVFPGASDTLDNLRALLAGMDRTQVLLWCARVNDKLSEQLAPPDLAKLNPFQRFRRRQQLLVRHFFNPEQIEKINGFFGKEAARQKAAITSVPMLPTVFFRGQVLELLRWACIFCPDIPNTYFDIPEARAPFAKALLIAGTLWNRRIYQKAAEEPLEAQGIGRLLVTFRIGRDQDASALDLTRALARGLKIFSDLLPAHYASYTKRDFNDDFLSATGLTLKQYYDCWAALMMPVVTSAAKDDLNLFAGPCFNPKTFCPPNAPELQALFPKFIALKSQTPDELRSAILMGRKPEDIDPLEPYSVKPLMPRPILRLKEDFVVVPDLDCLAQSAMLGPLFHVLSSGPGLNEIFGAFGESFHEYCGFILKGMFPARLALADRVLCPFLDTNNEEIADAYVDYGDAAVLSEIKSVFVDKAAEGANPDTYLSELDGKYISGKDRDQALVQLARGITSLADGSQVPSDLNVDQLKQLRLILPVLLVRDPLMDAPLHSRYLAEEFANALAPDDNSGNNMKKGRFIVTPLTVISIETLEDLESSKTDLRSLIQDYTATFPDRVLSLRNYLAISENQDKIRYSERLHEETSQQLERLKAYFR